MERRGLDWHRPSFWIWTAVVAAAILGVMLLALYFTGEPSFCGSCHEMKPEVNGWRAGTHKEVSCFACHSNPGAIGYLQAHVGDGLRDVWVHFTRRPDKIVVNSPIVPQSRCLACHAETPKGKAPVYPTQQAHPDHPPKDSNCTECHRDKIHGEKP
ncbi:MAG TPA: NapC/NirT family cytochrome c [Coriobacteriia bacterium]